jgi:hypothetical protein
LVTGLTKTVLETALDAELSEHLGSARTRTAATITAARAACRLDMTYLHICMVGVEIVVFATAERAATADCSPAATPSCGSVRLLVQLGDRHMYET